MPLRDLGELPADMAYAVTVMREDQGAIRPSPNHGVSLLCVGHIPVCTWETLFRMLGRGVVEVRPPVPGSPVSYGLAREWWEDKESTDAA
jgi:hypothetical protein